ncbi:replication initiator protein A [Lactiplantibacillus plantarum]
MGVDENDNVYFVFTNEELKQLFDCSNTKIAKIKKRTRGSSFVNAEANGFSAKSGSSTTQSVVFNAELKVNEKDVYLREKSQNNSQTLDTSRLPKNGNQHDTVDNEAQVLGTSLRLPKNGHDLYKDSKNTYKILIDTI